MELLEKTDSAVSSTDSTPSPSSEPSDARASGDGNESAAPDKSASAKPTVKLPASIKPPEKTGRFQQRISDLVTERNRERDEARRLRDEIAQLRNGHAPAGKASVQPGRAEADTSATLNPEDFATYADYIEAMVNRTVEQREAAKQSQKAESDYAAYRQEKINEFQTHAQPLADSYGEGFWDAVTDPGLPVSEAMADAVMELGEMAPYTMLWLAANRVEAQKMYKLNPRAATIAIGRLAAKLTHELEADGGAGSQGNVADAAPQPTGNAFSQPTAGRPRPSSVPTPRGSGPANMLDAQPGDKDDVTTWLQKETNRLRRINPNARFYGAQVMAWLVMLSTFIK